MPIRLKVSSPEGGITTINKIFFEKVNHHEMDLKLVLFKLYCNLEKCEIYIFE